MAALLTKVGNLGAQMGVKVSVDTIRVAQSQNAFCQRVADKPIVMDKLPMETEQECFGCDQRRQKKIV